MKFIREKYYYVQLLTADLPTSRCDAKGFINSLLLPRFNALMLLQFDIVHITYMERGSAKSTNNEKHIRFRHHITKTSETFTMIDVYK